jgi:nucleoside-diphosphate-sugar epimerase
MDVFLSGGTGVLGRPVLALLRGRGHRARFLSRTARSDAVGRELGAEPVRVDLFDDDGLRRAVAGSEAVLHLATRIPPTREALRREAWTENDRIRTEGSRCIVDAALAAGATTFVYPSVVFVYPDRGAQWIDAERAPLDAPDIARSTLVAEREVERFSASGGGRGVVLRMGGFYGPTAPTARELLATARRYRLAMVIGPADAYQSSIWVDDAAAAVVLAMERAPAGVYDAVDDEPMTRREVARAVGQAAGRPRVVRLPWPVARLIGGDSAMTVGRSQRVSNRRLREAAGWAPSVPDAREGFRRIAASPAR